MDNFRLDVTSEGPVDLERAMGLAFNEAQCVVAYSIEEEPKWRGDGVKRLVFFWAESEGATPLPFPMRLEQAADFAHGWLEHCEMPPEYDHDGHNKRGWRVYNEDWGHVGGQWEALLAVTPEWAMYGK